MAKADLNAAAGSVPQRQRFWTASGSTRIGHTGSFAPLEPMTKLQVDLADMKAFGFHAGSRRRKKWTAEPLKDRLATTTAAGVKKVFQTLAAPANVHSYDSSEFKREFKELMDFWDI